jgi:hypothetical protein
MAMGFAGRQADRVRESDGRAGALIEDMGRMKEELRRQGEDLERRRAQLDELLGAPGDEQVVALETLELMGEAQSRVHIDPSVVAEYVERMSWDEARGRAVDPEGAPWPAVTVYTSGQALWVADGFHRVEAARALGFEGIQCRLLSGDRRDAIRYSLSANARHGLRRTREDKRRAVRRALCDDTWRTWTDARVAELCSVSRGLVASTRERLERDGEIPGEVALYSADGREFEREPAAAAAPTARVRRAPARRAPEPAPTRDVEQTDWDALSPGGARAIVAYPGDASHYEALVECARDDALDTIVCPLMSGTPWLWRGPALMDPVVELGFGQPQVVEVGAWGKRFTVWTRGRESLEARAARDRDLLGDGLTRVVGRALDPWCS